MKLAVVVQRYGADLSGGAELHARYIAERLARHVSVEVLTTCAVDYITWRNTLAPGTDEINGLTVHRFPVRRERDPEEFGRRSEHVFDRPHSVADELAWLHSEGPTSPALVTYIRRHAAAYDYFVFFSYRYYHAYHGIRAVPSRAVLVPTAERDPVLGLSLFAPVFRGVRAIMYNSHEERALIRGVSANDHVPGVVVGVGSEIPTDADPDRFRQKTGIRDRFVLYLGRVDENKGCGQLFEFYRRYTASVRRPVRLVLVGSPVMPVPTHPLVRHLGFLSDQDKFDALAAADLLVMPSFYESLSMVTLEAWALGRPVLANGTCDVLRGQCVRSNAGLYYETYEEFAETLHAMLSQATLRRVLGENGRAYFLRHYTWPTIDRKYLDLLTSLRQEETAGVTRRMEAVPGWLARRRRSAPPSREIVDRLPRGPAPGDRPAAGTRSASREEASA